MYSRFYTRCFVIGAIVVLGWLLLQFLGPFWAPLGVGGDSRVPAVSAAQVAHEEAA